MNYINGFVKKNNIYNASLIVAIGFQIIHLVSIPFIISPDGVGYIRMAEILFNHDLMVEWNVLRTPLFPFFLRLSHKVLGYNLVGSFLFITSFSLISIVVLGFVIKKIVGVNFAAISIIMMTLYPLNIAYSHILLMETGLFFIVSASVYVLLKKFRNDYLHSLALSFLVIISFYFKPSLIYLVFVFSFFKIVFVYFSKSSGKFYLPGKKDFLSYFLIIAIIGVPSFIMTKPWNNFVAGRDVATKKSFMLAGLLMQGVIPENHPVIEAKKQDYIHAKESTLIDGKMQLDGIIGSVEFYPLMASLSNAQGSPARIFLDIIFENPLGYLSGLYRNALILFGANSGHNETVNYVIGLGNSQESMVQVAPSDVSHIKFLHENFVYHNGKSMIQQCLLKLISVYKVILFLGWISTFILLYIFLFRERSELYAIFSLFPFLYPLPFILLLYSSGRYCYPIYPLVMINILLVISYLRNEFKKRNNVRIVNL